ncbi:porin [Opitutus terrae]|uniref:Uncharacterized protein n=1 Tax=Opitutus terrae (strain DSM 11246 / JCM 15787 / PB90-1) TaxID=452637 RepID=B1ZTG2_OPITP|nr:porin [Opitutus terrae]ACB73907.1 conserved hypothetical protein [Opitutus terrae PB90-1]
MPARCLKIHLSIRGGRVIALALLGLVTAATAAASITWKNIQLGGFASQGWLYSSDNNLPTTNKGGTWDFRELGFNASTTLGARLRIGAQAFAQRFGEIGEDKVLLDWAIVDYSFHPTLGLRAGRIKYPKGLYGEALDLDALRPFVFLPMAVYNPVLRDFNASFDGGMAYGSLPIRGGSLDYKLFAGRIPMSAEKGVAEFVNDEGRMVAPGVRDLDMESVLGGQLTWNTPVDGLKFVYSYSEFRDFTGKGPFVFYPAVDFDLGFDQLRWHTLSAEYTWKNWVFASEWQRSTGDVKFSAKPILAEAVSDFGWDGWYVSAACRVHPKVELGTYYGSLKNSAPNPGRSPDQRDLAVSARYDLNDHVLFKLEVHYVDGTYQTFDTPRIPNPPATLSDDNVIVAVKTTFMF